MNKTRVMALRLILGLITLLQMAQANGLPSTLGGK
jgi:hypothetical protein